MDEPDAWCLWRDVPEDLVEDEPGIGDAEGVVLLLDAAGAWFSVNGSGDDIVLLGGSCRTNSLGTVFFCFS